MLLPLYFLIYTLKSLAYVLLFRTGSYLFDHYFKGSINNKLARRLEILEFAAANQGNILPIKYGDRLILKTTWRNPMKSLSSVKFSC